VSFQWDCRIFGVIYQVASAALHSKMYPCRAATTGFIKI
jgi:hypothetical protein